jgi:2-isopropylmalate synthase
MSFDHRKYRPFAPLHRPNRRWPDRVITQAPAWCAVDLRDGNQALVKPMNIAQKQRLFDVLVQIGFKEIEIGFPAASQPDFDFCRQLIEQNRVPADVTLQVLTQARPDLIARTFEALQGARRAVVHVYNSTSTVQREQVFRTDREGVKAIAVRGAELVQQHAQAHPDTEWVFQYSPESFTGTEPDYAVDVINAVTAVWRPDRGQPVIINLPATVEMATPNVFADQIEYVCDHINFREHLSISVHTHNDRGCAVAAGELAVMAGADRVEGTLLGNGERTGNMDLVTMAMNLYSQGIDPKLDFSGMAEIVRTVEACTDITTHPRHPYAGDLVFTAFSGSHQDAIRKCLQIRTEGARKENEPWQVAYLPIDPADVGRRYEEVVRINSQSGKGGVALVLERDYGITLPRWMQIELAQVVQAASEASGGEIDSYSIHRLFEQYFLAVPEAMRLHTYQLQRDDNGVSAIVETGNGDTLTGRGEGAVEALIEALSRRMGVRIEVDSYEEFAVDSGTKAQAMACIRLNVAGKQHSAAAQAQDTTTAVLQAVLGAAARHTTAARQPVMTPATA